MNKLVSTPTTLPTDWAGLYKTIQTQGNVPSPASQSLGQTHSVFQAMYLDLGVIAQTLLTTGGNPPLVTVYADVLNIPDNLNWNLQDSVLMVVARRIEAGANVRFNLDYRSGQNAGLVLFFNELGGAISAVAATLDQGAVKPWPFNITAPPGDGGLQILLQQGVPTLLTRTRAQGMPFVMPDAFESALTTSYIVASLLYDQRPDIALGIFNFNKDWAASSPNLLSVFLRSSAMVTLLSAQINAQKNGAAFVPYLTKQVYTDLAAAFVNQAKDYELNYLNLSTQSVITDNAILLAKTLLANQALQSDYVAKLLVQVQSNYANAVAAVDAAQAHFNDAKRTVELTAIDFKDKGIPEWERQKILEAVISLATAIVTFGVGIAAMMVGDEAAGAGSAKAAVDGAEAVAAAAKVGSDIAKTAKQLADVMKQLKTVVEGLKKVYELSKQVIAAANDIKGAQGAADSMSKLDVSTGGVDLTATYEWQIYQLNSDDAMAGPISQGVGYAGDLKLAIDNVAIYGQALAAAQVAAIKAGQQYATVQLQLALAQAQQQRLQQYVDQLVVGEQPISAMMQLFYQRYIDVKSSLFAAIEGYRASYFYWALQQSSVQPNIIDPIDKINAGLGNLTAITLDSQSALTRFSPPPQVMAELPVTINDSATLTALRTDGKITCTISADDVNFIGLDRVRLSRMRVWLEFANSITADYHVNVTITNTGNYLDRFLGTPYQFTSKPLQRDFRYSVSMHNSGNPDRLFGNGSYGYVIIDGAVDAEVSYAYFAPTPFSNWQLSISAPDMDLSGVSSIVMDFAGSAIAQGQNAALGTARIAARRAPVVLENSAVASCETD